MLSQAPPSRYGRLASCETIPFWCQGRSCATAVAWVI